MGEPVSVAEHFIVIRICLLQPSGDPGIISYVYPVVAASYELAARNYISTKGMGEWAEDDRLIVIRPEDPNQYKLYKPTPPRREWTLQELES